MKNEEKLINFWKNLLFLDKKVTEPHIDIDSSHLTVLERWTKDWYTLKTS